MINSLEESGQWQKDKTCSSLETEGTHIRRDTIKMLAAKSESDPW